MIAERLLTPALSAAIESCGYSLPQGMIPSLARLPLLSNHELSCAVAFPLGAKEDQSPLRLANELAAQLAKEGQWQQHVEETVVSDGFINITLSGEAHNHLLQELSRLAQQLPQDEHSLIASAGAHDTANSDSALQRTLRMAARLQSLLAAANEERADVYNATTLPPASQVDELGFSSHSKEGTANRRTLLRLCEFVECYPERDAIKAHAHRFEKETYVLVNDLEQINQSSSFVDSTGGITKTRLQLAHSYSGVLLYAAHCLRLLDSQN